MDGSARSGDITARSKAKLSEQMEFWHAYPDAIWGHNGEIQGETEPNAQPAADEAPTGFVE